MDTKRAKQLAGVTPKDHINESAETLNENTQIKIAVVRDGGDGAHIGVVGPFKTRDEMNTFFKKWGDDLHYELEDIMSPQHFAETMEDE